MKLHLSILTIALLTLSCTQRSPTVPKPRAYSRVERTAGPMGEHRFADFRFWYPPDANMTEKREGESSSLWFNIQYPEFGATLYCTFLHLGTDGFGKAMEDNNRFLAKESSANRHVQVREESYSNPTEPVYGRLYYLHGNAIAPFQFYLTDSTHYFLRGSLYYDIAVNADSVAPITESLREDIVKLMETFRYKPEK